MRGGLSHRLFPFYSSAAGSQLLKIQVVRFQMLKGFMVADVFLIFMGGSVYVLYVVVQAFELVLDGTPPFQCHDMHVATRCHCVHSAYFAAYLLEPVRGW